MPELPEVETIKNTLTPLICGDTIIKAHILRSDVIKYPDASTFAKNIEGKKIASLGRRGKYLLFLWEQGGQMVVHLRMTGRMLYSQPNDPLLKHTHVIFDLASGAQLRFSDTRRFGCLWLLEPDEEDCYTGMSKLGPEPLGSDFSALHLKRVLGKRKVNIKQGLLDQRMVAGLGNIYVDESLFAAAIAPTRFASSLTDEEWKNLTAAIVCVLQDSITHNGTTFSDYVDGRGQKGENMSYLKAYKREGQPCLRCGSPLQRIKIAGRSSFFCPECQR